jgi:hypothetical protein
MMSEDLFFNKVKETMHGYAPEVPASVYGGMRKKYARSKFFSWNASTLNVWYVALFAVVSAVVIGTSVDSNATASKAGSINVETEMLPMQISATPEFVVTETKSCEKSSTVLNHYKGEPCLFPSSLVEVKNETPIVQEVVVEAAPAEPTAAQETQVEGPTEVAPAKEEKVEAAPKKATRKIKAPIYKDRQ